MQRERAREVLEEFAAAAQYGKRTLHKSDLEGFHPVWSPATFGPGRRRNDLRDDFDPGVVDTLLLFGVSSRWIEAQTGWGRNRINRVRNRKCSV